MEAERFSVYGILTLRHLKLGGRMKISYFREIRAPALIHSKLLRRVITQLGRVKTLPSSLKCGNTTLSIPVPLKGNEEGWYVSPSSFACIFCDRKVFFFEEKSISCERSIYSGGKIISCVKWVDGGSLRQLRERRLMGKAS